MCKLNSATLFMLLAIAPPLFAPFGMDRPSAAEREQDRRDAEQRHREWMERERQKRIEINNDIKNDMSNISAYVADALQKNGTNQVPFLAAATIGYFAGITQALKSCPFIIFSKDKKGNDALVLLQKRLAFYNELSSYVQDKYTSECIQSISFLEYRLKLLHELQKLDKNKHSIFPNVVAMLIVTYAHDEELAPQKSSCVIQ